MVGLNGVRKKVIGSKLFLPDYKYKIYLQEKLDRLAMISKKF